MSVQAFFMPKFVNDTTSTTVPIRDPTQPNTPGNVTQTFPYAGTIKRILIGCSGDLGDGTVRIGRFPNGLSPAVNLATVPFVGEIGTATTKITYDQSYEKDDGLVLQLVRNTIIDTETLTITLEIEYSFV